MPITTLRFDGDGRDLTLDELAGFIEHARRAKVPRSNPLRAELSSAGRIVRLEVAVETDED
jgi:hypothetical protein